MSSTKNLSNTEILNFDQKHIWHPYSRVGSDMPLFSVASAQGAYITLHSGERLFDGMSSWWSTIHGYNHPRLNRAAHTQIDTMSHVMFGGLTHEPAVNLAKQLIEHTPPDLDKVFFSDSGSVSVEVALKMALQYWHAKGKPRTRFLTIERGYHGDTFGAMSVCDPTTGMHQLFSNFLPQNIFTEQPQCGFDQPWEDHYFDDFANKAEQHQEDIAAVIIEPIVQGTGGMRFYSPVFLQKIRALCDHYDFLLIADEIATGFGRTGKLFACEYAGISPDILCLGKALTGGYMSLAATLCNDDVATTVCQGEAGVFMHGPTFMANPLACAIANESMSLLLESPWQSNVAKIGKALHQGLQPCTALPNVNEIRVLGAIGVVELHEAVDMKRIQPMLVEQGIWLRPFGKLVYTMPPFIATEEEISYLCEKIVSVLHTLSTDNR